MAGSFYQGVAQIPRLDSGGIPLKENVLREFDLSFRIFYARNKDVKRLFKEILAGKITLAELQKASNWKEKEEKILSRLGAFSQLKRLMDEFLLIYEFSGEKLARQDPPIWTKIEADYLVKFALEEGKTFYFSVKQKGTYCGRSIFVNDEQDYSTGQTKFTLLEKIRTNQQTGETELLYRKETYKK